MPPFTKMVRLLIEAISEQGFGALGSGVDLESSIIRYNRLYDDMEGGGG